MAELVEGNLIKVGRIVGSRGNRGEVKVKLLTDFPERFRDLQWIYLIDPEDKLESRKIEKVWYHKNFVIIKFEGVETISKAEILRGRFLAIKREEAVRLPEGSYYFYEVIGLNVYTEEEKYLGKVEEIWKTGSNDVYVVKNGEQELLLPAIREVIRKIDLIEKKIIVHLLEGL